MWHRSSAAGLEDGAGQAARHGSACEELTLGGHKDPALTSVETCTWRRQHTLDAGVLGPGQACPHQRGWEPPAPSRAAPEGPAERCGGHPGVGSSLGLPSPQCVHDL